MPSYEYNCPIHGEFEAFHSIRDDAKLTECPTCRSENDISTPVNRLVSGGSGRGIMDQTIEELKAAMPGEIAKKQRRAARDENFLANLVGETKYNRNQR